MFIEFDRALINSDYIKWIFIDNNFIRVITDKDDAFEHFCTLEERDARYLELKSLLQGNK